MPTEHPLQRRVRRQLRSLGLGGERTRLVVALSGGCDSVVLLHLLRFHSAPLRLEIVAAHLDHAIRPTSAADALWVRGLCAAWDVPLVDARLESVPASEARAREARYAFLRRVAAEAGGALIATAHHADDQAETVLFRALRGTGLHGLAGIAPLEGDVVRPLLPLWRRELEAYARAQGLAWRTDATNDSLEPARNRLRHEVLPLVERTVAPGARRNLASLARLAAEAEAALDRLAEQAERELVAWREGAPSLARDRLRAYDSAVASRVLRNVLRPFGVVLGRTGTRRVLQFITDASSGRRMPLGGGLIVELEFERAVVRRREEVAPDVELVIAAAGAGTGVLRIGGAEYRVRYDVSEGVADGAGDGAVWRYLAGVADLAFPLRLRAWRDGDRMRTARGRRRLKRVFLERRVPRDRRHRLPLLVDTNGDVLWVAGLSAGGGGPTREGVECFTVTIVHD